jgi:hypothetical protein
VKEDLKWKLELHPQKMKNKLGLGEEKAGNRDL